MSHLAMSSFLLLNLVFTTLLTGCAFYKSQGRKTFESQADGKLTGQSVAAACIPTSAYSQFQICFQNSDLVPPGDAP